MPGQSVMMFLSVIAIAIASKSADDSRSVTTPASRGPASISGKKELGLLQRDLLKHTHKVRGPLATSIEVVGAAPEQPGDVFILKGVISAEQSLENIEFAWRIPAGVEIVNGEASSEVKTITEGKPFTTQITLRQLSAENARVSLRVRGRDESMRFGDSAVYHSLDQQKLESARAELQKTNESYMKSDEGKEAAPEAQSQSKGIKVFH